MCLPSYNFIFHLSFLLQSVCLVFSSGAVKSVPDADNELSQENIAAQVRKITTHQKLATDESSVVSL